MSKRAPQFERRERDYYPTPEAAVRPLLAHLEPGTRFVEPCAGDGRLIDYLTGAGHVCVDAWDIEPRRADIACDDAKIALHPEFLGADCYITNPPWDRSILHPIIRNLAKHRPTWLLFDADWIHTRQAAPFMPILRRIVSVGRVKWIEDSPHTGKDNACWYLFDANAAGPVVFIGRSA